MGDYVVTSTDIYGKPTGYGWDESAPDSPQFAAAKEANNALQTAIEVNNEIEAAIAVQGRTPALAAAEAKAHANAATALLNYGTATGSTNPAIATQAAANATAAAARSVALLEPIAPAPASDEIGLGTLLTIASVARLLGVW